MYPKFQTQFIRYYRLDFSVRVLIANFFLYRDRCFLKSLNSLPVSFLVFPVAKQCHQNWFSAILKLMTFKNYSLDLIHHSLNRKFCTYGRGCTLKIILLVTFIEIMTGVIFKKLVIAWAYLDFQTFLFNSTCLSFFIKLVIYKFSLEKKTSWWHKKNFYCVACFGMLILRKRLKHILCLACQSAWSEKAWILY